jgi:hypothetical protein
LSEIAADLGRAETLKIESDQYIKECEILRNKWEEKTRRDCDHIQERIESLVHSIREIDLAMSRREVRGLRKAN